MSTATSGIVQLKIYGLGRRSDYRIICSMEQLESGLYYLSPEEMEELAPAAEHYEHTYGKDIDITKPLELEEAMFLQVSRAALAGDRDALQAALAILDDAIAKATQPN